MSGANGETRNLSLGLQGLVTGKSIGNGPNTLQLFKQLSYIDFPGTQPFELSVAKSCRISGVLDVEFGVGSPWKRHSNLWGTVPLCLSNK